MKTEETIVTIIFDAGRGSVSEESREARVGEAYGSLPTPTLRGHRFEGWYDGETRVTSEAILESESDVQLAARWTRVKESKKASSYKRQKFAVILLCAIAVALIVTWVIVSEIISIYTLTDTYVKDGKEYSDTYTIKREDGVYKLFDSDGNLMPNGSGREDVFIADRGIGNQYRIDPETGEYRLQAVVIPDDGEAVQGTSLLLFPEIPAKYMYAVEVKQASGESYKFLHTSGDKGFYLEGLEDSLASFDDQLFSKFCLATGWTVADRKLTAASNVAKLPDGSINYAVYGLENPSATFTVESILFKKDAKGNTVYKNNAPVIDYTETTDENGDTVKVYRPDPERTYTVKIGDPTPDKSGYYVQMEGGSSVYILSASYIGETVLKPVEAMVVPQAFHNVTVNLHNQVNEFYLTRLPEWSEEGADRGDVVVFFTYEPLDARENTMSVGRPYRNLGAALMEGYEINDAAATEVLTALYGIKYASCVKLGKLNQAALEKYGLDKNIYYLRYGVDLDEKDGKELYVDNEVIISAEKNENGNYYIASLTYDMIVEVSPTHLPFMEWEASKWYAERFLSQNIAYLKDLVYTIDGKTYDFSFDNTLSYCYYLKPETDDNGNVTGKVLTAVDSYSGQLKQKGNKIVYQINGGAEYDVIILDLDNVEVLSYRDAILNPNKANVVYTDVLYYYVSATKGNVQVVPNFKDKDIVSREGVFYYVEYDSKGNVKTEIQVIRQLGDAIYRYQKGYEATIMVAADFLKITLNNKLLDYTATNTIRDDMGVERVESVTALDNFRRLLMQLVTYSLDGDVDEEEFRAYFGKSISEFLASEREADATLTIAAEDYASILNAYTYYSSTDQVDKLMYTENQQKNMVVRFYKYADWKALVTIQTFVIDENGEKIYSEAGENGQFFVDAGYLDKLQESMESLYHEKVI